MPNDVAQFLADYDATVPDWEGEWRCRRQELKFVKWVFGPKDMVLRHSSTGQSNGSWYIEMTRRGPHPDENYELVSPWRYGVDRLALPAALVFVGMMLKHKRRPEIPQYEDEGPAFVHPEDESRRLHPFELDSEDDLQHLAEWFPVDDFEEFIEDVATVRRFTGLDLPATTIEDNLTENYR